MIPTQHTRTIPLTDLCQIIRETAQQSVPTLVEIGEALSSLGETCQFDPARIVGEAIESIARLTIQSLDYLERDGVTPQDENGSRSIQDQVLAKRVQKAVIAHIEHD